MRGRLEKGGGGGKREALPFLLKMAELNASMVHQLCSVQRNTIRAHKKCSFYGEAQCDAPHGFSLFLFLPQELFFTQSCTLEGSKRLCSLCSYDNRRRPGQAEAQHWSDRDVLQSRASFHTRTQADTASLRLRDVEEDDDAVYKCRVDFGKAPTKVTTVRLRIIGE